MGVRCPSIIHYFWCCAETTQSNLEQWRIKINKTHFNLLEQWGIKINKTHLKGLNGKAVQVAQFIQSEGKGKNAFESSNVLNEKHSLEWNLHTEWVQTTLTEEERGNQ